MFLFFANIQIKESKHILLHFFKNKKGRGERPIALINQTTYKAIENV